MSTPALMTGDLSRTEVEAHVRGIGMPWSWRTVERFIAAGFIDRPRSPGRGRGRGRDYLYPYRILAQLDAVAAAHRPKHPRRLNPMVVAHRLWWDGHRPDLFEPWCADRLQEAAFDHEMEEKRRAMSDDEYDREVQVGAALMRKRRVGPPHAERESVVAWTVDIHLGRGLLPDLDAPFDDRDHRTVGQVLDRGLGVMAMQAQGIHIPGKPGEFAVHELGMAPPASVCHWVLCRATPEEAGRARDRLVAREVEARRQGRLIFGRNLRDWPHGAGVFLAGALAWGVGATTIRPPVPTTCPGCSASPTASPDQLALHCPAWGGGSSAWCSRAPPWSARWFALRSAEPYGSPPEARFRSGAPR